MLFLGVVIGVVLLLSGAFSGGDGDDAVTTVDSSGIGTKRAPMPALPPGLVALSDFVEFDTDGDVSATIALPLRSRPDDEAGLGFYNFLEERWQRVADVRLESNGQRAEADFSPLPRNLAVLRVVAQAYQVAASLPSGGTLHPDAKAGILSPRDYKPLSDGSLEGTATDLPTPGGELVIPTVVGSSEDTSAVVNDILRDESLRAQHVQAIVQLAAGAGFAGIDLEYSNVDPELRSEFTLFVQELGRALRDDGRRLSLTLPPPAEQRQAYDWPLLGQAADIIRILPIADPIEYWNSMPDALDTLVQDVDPRKVMLVVSPFSTEVTDDGSRTLGYLEAMLLATEIKVREPEDPANIETDVGVKVVAVNLAQSEGSTDLAWSDDAAALTFSYGTPDRHTIYVENVFSVGFKLELAQAWGLGGIAVSDASAATDTANIWPAVNMLVDTGTATLLRPNGDALVPRWEAPDGGNLDAAAGPSVIWRADEARSYVLRMLISDGDVRFGREITVDVKAKPEPQLTPLVTFGPEPTATPTPTPSPTATPTSTPDVAPAPPSGLILDNSTPGQFDLSWDPSTAADLAGYNVYAKQSPSVPPNAPYEHLNPDELLVVTSYTDADFTLPDDQGNTYCYVVTAVDAAGHESDFSDPVCGQLT